MYVCMYVYVCSMYVCIYVCMYVCMCVWSWPWDDLMTFVWPFYVIRRGLSVSLTCDQVMGDQSNYCCARQTSIIWGNKYRNTSQPVFAISTPLWPHDYCCGLSKFVLYRYFISFKALRLSWSASPSSVWPHVMLRLLILGVGHLFILFPPVVHAWVTKGQRSTRRKIFTQTHHHRTEKVMSV